MLEWVILNAKQFFQNLKQRYIDNETYLENKLNKIKIEWNRNKCMAIVICTFGYPNKYKTNKIINLEKIKLKKKFFYISCWYSI